MSETAVKQNKQDAKFLRMTTAPLEPLIVKLAVPTMISMLVTTLYNLADTYFVGQLKEVPATAAVTVSLSLMNIIQSVGFLFGQGSGNYISRALCGKEEEKCRRMASTGFFYAIGAGFLIMIFGLIFLKPLALFCGSEEDPAALGYTLDYMRIILIGAPFMCGSLVLNNQLRFQGNATFAMIGLSSGAVVNVLLDALLVPQYKVLGAAVATASCQVMSFTVLLICTFRFSDNVRYSVKDFTPSLFYYKEIFRGGFPSLCRQGVAYVMKITLIHCCKAVSGEMGAHVVQAAFGIVSKLMMLVSGLMIGFGQGFQPVCGFCYGAKRYDRVMKGFRFCVMITGTFLIVMAAVFYFACPTLLEMMQASGDAGLAKEEAEETVKLAITIMRCQLLTLPLMSFVVMGNMSLQTSGNVVGASVLAMGRQGLFLIPMMYLLAHSVGMNGLVWAQPVADVLAFFISVPFVWALFKKMKNAAKKEVKDADLVHG